MGLLFSTKNTVNKYMIQFINWDWLDYILKIRYICWQLSHFTIVMPLEDIHHVFFPVEIVAFLACLTRRSIFEKYLFKMHIPAWFLNPCSDTRGQIQIPQLHGLRWKLGRSFSQLGHTTEGGLGVNVPVVAVFACSLCHTRYETKRGIAWFN